MASESRPQGDSLDVLSLVSEYGNGQFFAIVRFLEQLLDGRAPIGEVGPVEREPVRFRHDHSLAFSTGDVMSVSPCREAALSVPAAVRPTWPAFELRPSFLGLTGCVTPLPQHMADEVAQESANPPVLQDFFDAFHHRFYSLFYRAISQLSLPAEFERAGADKWSQRVLATRGLDTEAARPYEIVGEIPSTAATSRDDGLAPVKRSVEAPLLEAWQLLRLLPLLSFPTCAQWVLEAALRDVLRDYLEGASLRIEPLIGEWGPMQASDRMRLGVANSELNLNTIIGGEVFDRGRIRIMIGPLTHAAYQRFQHDKRVAQLMTATIALFRKEHLDCEMALRLSDEGSPRFRFSSSHPCRLGVDTFLGGPAAEDVIVPLPRLGEV